MVESADRCYSSCLAMKSAIDKTSRAESRAPGNLNRRALLKRLAGGAAVLGASLGAPAIVCGEPEPAPYRAKNGRIQQSVIHWCFKPMTPPELADNAAAMGLKSVELVSPELWPKLKELGLVCAIAPSHGFVKGFAHRGTRRMPEDSPPAS